MVKDACVNRRWLKFVVKDAYVIRSWLKFVVKDACVNRRWQKFVVKDACVPCTVLLHMLCVNSTTTFLPNALFAVALQLLLLYRYCYSIVVDIYEWIRAIFAC